MIYARFKSLRPTTRRFLIRIPLYTALGWLLIWWGPFDIANKTKAAWQSAIYRLYAPLYNSEAQSNIAIILIDDTAIANLYHSGYINANDWPLTYADHARLLQRVVNDYKPRLVFGDIYFEKERRTDDSAKFFLKTLGRLRKTTPIIFAGDISRPHQTDFQKSLNDVPGSDGDGLSPVFWQGHGNAYPLVVSSGASQQRTPAAELFWRLCAPSTIAATASATPGERKRHTSQIKCPPFDYESLDKDGYEPTSLSVIWTAKQPIVPAGLADSDSCASPAPSPIEAVGTFFANLALGFLGTDPDTTRALCAPHLIVYADQLMLSAPATLREALAGRIVLYGANIRGIPDYVISPVHGSMPGVTVHAMALDNLLHFGNRYVRSGDIGHYLNALAWAACVLMASLLLLWREKRLSITAPLLCKTCRQPLQHGGHGFLLLFIVATSTLILLSFGLFALLPFEPVNALELSGLAVLLNLMIRRNSIERTYAWLRELANNYRINIGHGGSRRQDEDKP